MEILNKFPLPLLLIDQDYNVVWMNEEAKRLYPNRCEKCHKLTHNSELPCFVYTEHPCPVKEMKDKGVDKYAVVHRHVVEGRESLVLVMAQRTSDNLFLELHLPLDKVLTAFEVGKLRPELLINSGPLAFFVWQNKEGWPVKSVSKSVYELTEYTQEEFLSGVIDYAKLIHSEDLQRVSEEVRLNTESKSDYWTHQPYRIITKSGKVKWVLDHTVSIKDNSGNYLRILRKGTTLSHPCGR
ncbi:PAS domain-containing protein [Thermocrinis sp.]|uniref:PAS domain-containing protein n=1 Tax=Thermocrinis sp. TaxID=2024383 RepID=UPI002FDDE251